MNLVWIGFAAWAGPAEQAQDLLERGWTEAAIAVLDSGLDDPAAALLRFELAEATGDDDAFDVLLTPAIVAALPWSTRDVAHLALARRAAAVGEIEVALTTLEAVYPDAPVWPEARLLAGDLLAARGRQRDALYAWGDAVRAGADGQGLTRIAAAYEALERPATAAGYLAMIEPADPSWGPSRVALARTSLAAGDEGTAFGALVALDHATWAPEADLLRAQAWAARAGAVAGEEEARARIVAAAESLELPVDPAAAWVRRGDLPPAFLAAFLRRDDVADRVGRLARIDEELVEVAVAGLDALVAALAARRAATVEALGRDLLAAMARERERLAQVLAAPPVPAAERPPGATCSIGFPSRRWPFRGEIWADEMPCP